MYGSIFPLNLGGDVSARDRGKAGRSLATALSMLHGFIAFLALEAEDGAATALCICSDAATVEQAKQIVDAWHREQGRPVDAQFEPLIAGEIIVQRGL